MKRINIKASSVIRSYFGGIITKPIELRSLTQEEQKLTIEKTISEYLKLSGKVYKGLYAIKLVGNGFEATVEIE